MLLLLLLGLKTPKRELKEELVENENENNDKRKRNDLYTTSHLTRSF